VSVPDFQGNVQGQLITPGFLEWGFHYIVNGVNPQNRVVSEYGTEECAMIWFLICTTWLDIKSLTIKMCLWRWTCFALLFCPTPCTYHNWCFSCYCCVNVFTKWNV